MLEQCCNFSKQCRNNVATPCCAKNRRCESSRVTSPWRPSYTLLLWRNCRMCLQKILFPVFMFAFIFSLLLIFTWPLTFLINYRTAAMKVSCFSSNEIRLPSSFSVVHVSLNIKNNVKKTRLCCCCFFLSKSPGGHAIFFSCIWVAIPVDWVILYWFACGADGRSLGVRSRN